MFHKSERKYFYNIDLSYYKFSLKYYFAVPVHYSIMPSEFSFREITMARLSLSLFHSSLVSRRRKSFLVRLPRESIFVRLSRVGFHSLRHRAQL